MDCVEKLPTILVFFFEFVLFVRDRLIIEQILPVYSNFIYVIRFFFAVKFKYEFEFLFIILFVFVQEMLNFVC